MKKLMVGLTLGLFMLGFTGMSHATSYTDEAAWRAAAGTFAFENFDSMATGTDISQLPALGISFDTLNDSTYPTVQPYSFTGGMMRSGPNNLLNDRDNTLPGRGPLTIRPIDASEFIFGLGLWNVGGDDQLSLNFYDGTNQLIEQVISASGIGFFGIINPIGAKYAVIGFVGGNGYAPVDDFQTATRENFGVPEPTTMLLFGLGLVGLAGFRRKKQ